MDQQESPAARQTPGDRLFTAPVYPWFKKRYTRIDPDATSLVIPVTSDLQISTSWIWHYILTNLIFG